MSNPGDFAYHVKQQADIVRIVGDYVKLRKSGAQNFSGLCPFHSEKSPSFSVHATKQFFHCFGCGVSGDVFTFVQKIENSTFPEAVRTVATKLGIPLPKQQLSPTEAKEQSLRAKLLEIHERATTFFEEQLRTEAGATARGYLTNRGIDQKTVDSFRIGYAPDSGFLLRDRLKNEFDEASLRQSGLFSWKEEQGTNIYSKFRSRVTFPIANESGKVIAFTARTLSAEKEAGPKYINSPETAIYSKGRVLFNLDKAKEAIRQLDYTIVVEGQMDCIRVYTAGLHNVIASSGTAFGEVQIKLLGRYSKNIVVNFDPDTAGAAATERSLAALIEEDFNVRVVTLDQGLDPDMFIRQRGVDAYKEAIKQSRKYFHYLIDRAQQQFPGKSPEAKVKQVNYLLPHIQRVPNRIARDELATEVAQRLDIDSGVLRQELKSAAVSRSQQVSERAIAKPQLSPAEKIVIRALYAAGDPIRATAQDVLANEHLHQGWTSESLLQALANADDATIAEPLSLPLDDASRTLLANTLLNETDTPPTADELRVAFTAMRRPHLEREMRRISAQIDEASRKGDQQRSLQLTSELVRLKRAISELGRPTS
jgi:DNA primase